MTKPELSTYLVISGEALNFDELTMRVGVEPTSVHCKGDKVAHSSVEKRADEWILRIGPELGLDLGDQLRRLRETLQGATHTLASLAEESGYVTRLYCVIYLAGNQTPVIGLSEEMMQWCCDARLPLEIDVMLSA